MSFEHVSQLCVINVKRNALCLFCPAAIWSRYTAGKKSPQSFLSAFTQASLNQNTALKPNGFFLSCLKDRISRVTEGTFPCFCISAIKPPRAPKLQAAKIKEKKIPQSFKLAYFFFNSAWFSREGTAARGCSDILIQGSQKQISCTASHGGEVCDAQPVPVNNPGQTLDIIVS